MVQASGDPIMKDAKNPSLAGYRMKYNMKSRIGEVYYRDDLSGQSEGERDGSAQTSGHPAFYIARGDFSTCDDSTRTSTITLRTAHSGHSQTEHHGAARGDEHRGRSRGGASDDRRAPQERATLRPP